MILSKFANLSLPIHCTLLSSSVHFSFYHLFFLVLFCFLKISLFFSFFLSHVLFSPLLFSSFLDSTLLFSYFLFSSLLLSSLLFSFLLYFPILRSPSPGPLLSRSFPPSSTGLSDTSAAGRTRTTAPWSSWSPPPGGRVVVIFMIAFINPLWYC